MRPRRPGIRSTRSHRLPAPRKPRSDRILINREILHRYFWRRRNPQDRVSINLEELADSLACCYDVARDVVHDMRDEGRIRGVTWKFNRERIYQVANPYLYDPSDETTHARQSREPQWG